MPKGEKTFEANVDMLYEELVAAHRWSKPSLLVVVCADYWIQKKAFSALEIKLHKTAGLFTKRLNFHKQTSNVSQAIINLGQSRQDVVFAYNLDLPENGDEYLVYRALNQQREFFTEQGIRMVLWLNPQEASRLPLQAPDFWAFRRQVVEFSSAKKIQARDIGCRLMIWHTGRIRETVPELEARILELNRLLSNLPPGSSSIVLESNLRGELAYLHWLTGDQENSMKNIQRGLSLNEQTRDLREAIRFMNMLAVLEYARRNYKEAEKILKGLDEKSGGDDPVVAMNYAIALTCNGKREPGLNRANQAFKLDPRNSLLASRLGYLNFLAGRMNDAIAWLEHAVSLLPEEEFRLALAICNHLADRKEADFDALAAGAIESESKACIEFLHGRHEAAARILIAEAVKPGNSWARILNNPNLWLVTDPNTALPPN
jgi:tetratricopeptide (TPR) repeat protein